MILRSFVANLIILCFVLHFLHDKAMANEIDDKESPAGNLKLYTKSGFIMGSLMNISIYERDEKKVNSIVKMAFDEVKRLDRLMSNYKDDSELSRINREAAKGRTVCDGELLYIIGQSLYYSKITDGAFDITVYPTVNLWGFYGDNDGNIVGHIPDEKELQDLLPAVSYKNIAIDNIDAANGAHGTIFFKNSKTRIDLGAIGKGYAVDKVVEIFKREGIKSALVNFAGNIYAFGSPPGRKEWIIGLKDPTDTANIIGSFRIKDRAVATSGDYERFFVSGDKRYTHIIDPRNGRPVIGILSVTIISDTATMADALSTGVFVLGPSEGLKLIENIDGVEGIIIFESGKSNIDVKMSDGFKEVFEASEQIGRGLSSN